MEPLGEQMTIFSQWLREQSVQIAHFPHRAAAALMCTYIHVKRPPFKAHTNNWSLQRARNARGGCIGKKRACGARSLIRCTSRKLKALQLPFLITRKKVQARCCVPRKTFY